MKRLFDILSALLGLVILAPVFLLISLLIKLDSKGPVLYRQQRVGRYNRDFTLFKFRSMYPDADKRGLLLTTQTRDPRISPIGHWLRKYKLDELPQLWNVLKGDMSLVGPRPEVRKYVSLYTHAQLAVLHVRPGITDLASIKYADESGLLEKQEDPEAYYINVIMPDKLDINLASTQEINTVRGSLRIVGLTLQRILTAVLLTTILCSQSGHLMAQTVPVGLLPGLEDYYRRQQLLGMDSLDYSFNTRPFFLSSLPASLQQNLQRTIWSNEQYNMALKALPLVWKQQVNSHHPYSLNDGAMIPSKGYSTLLSTGLAFEAGILSIQLRPELVYAQNSSYPLLTDYDQPGTLLSAYHAFQRRIDVPVRFGEGAYSRVDLGQSSVRLNYAGMSLGVSNENLWWGPGRHHTLLMSNNAPGFKHITFNSIRPITSGIGSFEWQLVSGRLDGSGIGHQVGEVMHHKPTDWRYFNGLVFSYQPKWVPGLSLGFDRSMIQYSKTLGNGFMDYLPVFNYLTKSSFADDSHSNTEDDIPRDQRMSFFTRWVMPESHAEVYFQYGREDHAWNWRDAIIEPEHSRAYMIGFRKLFPFGAKPDEFVQIGMEAVQMDPSSSNRVRSMGYWYLNSSIMHGYTHRGQYLGNGYGPDNVQTLDLAWMRGMQRLGMVIERRVHNNELYLRAHSATMDSRKRWVDLNFIGQVDWDYRGVMLNAQAGLIRSLNYQYYLPTPPDNEYWYGPKNDVNNWHLKVSLLYGW